MDSWRMQTDHHRTSDEYGLLYRSMMDYINLKGEDVDGVIISSVVPVLTGVFAAMCRRFFGRDALLVGPGLKTGMPILYENPREVGADWIVNAVAAFSRFQKAGIIVDFGTATTFDAINAEGAYLGGVIAPGSRISAEALFQRASKLPRVDIAKPPRIIGRNTVHSMQSGLFYGYVGLVDGIVREMKTELDDSAFVIATGGLAELISSHSSEIEEVHGDLTLEGLRILYERNA